MTSRHLPYGEPIRILLVEDNPAHAELILRNFETHQIANQIMHLNNGAQALDYLFRQGIYTDPSHSPRPHLILLDLRLPKIDGLEVLRAIKEVPELRPIPVVVLTTSEAEQDAFQAYQHHVNSYLVKPVDFEKFAELMKELGFYWLIWNYYPWP